MSGRGGNRSETFTVPAGKRAVVLHVACLLWTASGQSVFLFVHGIPVWFLRNQVADEPHFVAVRFTAYEGESIRFVCAGSDISYALDGFLLADDTGGRPDDADNVVTTP